MISSSTVNHGYSSFFNSLAAERGHRDVDSATSRFDVVPNPRPFLAFWKAVIQDGDYLKALCGSSWGVPDVCQVECVDVRVCQANWFVKVDPDTVWFPARLLPILRQQEAGNLIQERSWNSLLFLYQVVSSQ